jgi:phage terminase large subunit-like protein
VGRDPVVLGVRPLEGIEGVWEALVDDRDGAKPRVILTMGPKVIRFIERCCVTTQARWAGAPFKLLDWQKNLLCELFEVEWSGDRGRYVRRYHEALIGTPKKNGKSDWLAGVGLYFLVADGEPSPVVVAAAANETSAKLVFTPAKTMVDLSHGALEANLLEDLCDAWDSQIFLRGQANAEMRKVPASPKATEGLNIFVNLMDEWHEWTHPAATQTATKLQNGTALRPDYMNLRTTTAGHDLESLCGEDYEFGKAVAAGEVDAPEWFFSWYEAPREVERDGKIVALDWRSEEAVALSNPSYGALAQWPFYANKLRREKESIYRRYFLNQWTETEEAWLPTGAWEGCEAAHLEPEAGWPTAIGWDAATKHDSTAVVLAQ